MSALWLAPMLLFPKKTRVLAAVIGVVLWACSMASLGYFFIYQQEFSQSVIFIMFESNVSEAGEYMTQYFAWWMVLAFLAHTAFAYFLWTRLRPCTCPVASALVAATAILVAVVGYPLIKQTVRAAVWRKDRQIRNPHRACGAVADGRGLSPLPEHLAGMQDMLTAPARSRRCTTSRTHGQPARDPGTGHRRIHQPSAHEPVRLSAQTTPELDKLKDQLAVFDNVITRAPTPSRRCNRC
jgi:heptose-I-phosphate ethanolaminephosphotransferase